MRGRLKVLPLQADKQASHPVTPMARLLLPLLLITAPLLASCDLLGIQPASALAAQKEAEGKAVGGACRHAGRAIEDCYALNRKADKSAIFAGWREMNDYMRENKIDEVTPQLTAPPAVAQSPREPGEEGAAAAAQKTGESAAGKSARKSAS